LPDITFKQIFHRMEKRMVPGNSGGPVSYKLRLIRFMPSVVLEHPTIHYLAIQGISESHNPVVMRLNALRNRHTKIQQLTPDTAAATHHEAFQGKARGADLPYLGQSHLVQLPIRKRRIVHHHQRLRVTPGNVNHVLDLLWKPHIILVTEKHQITGRLHKCRIEVAAVAQVFFVTVEPDGKGRDLGELPDDGFGLIGGAVVGDDQLIRLAGLVYEAMKLLLDVLGTVVGGHGYGDFHC